MLDSGQKEAKAVKMKTKQVQVALPNKAERYLTLTSSIHAEVLRPLDHHNTRKTTEHARDAKNTNLDDSQPKGKVRNSGLIFFCVKISA